MLFLSKFIEWAAAEQLQAFLEEMLALCLFQSGSLPVYGTEMVLVVLTNDLCKQRGCAAVAVRFFQKHLI